MFGVKELIFLVLIGLFCWSQVLSVDHGNFKTCEQSSFCRRCRNADPSKLNYTLNLESLVITDTAIEVEVVNQIDNFLYKLVLSGLTNRKFRIQIDEIKGLRNRFQPIYTLKDDILLSNLEVVERNNAKIVIKSGLDSVTLLANPFKLEFRTDANLVLVANADNLFTFEHFRQKPEQVSNDQAENGVDVQTEEDPGAWEENFKSHHDKKSYGPSAVALDFTFIGATHLYGIPEHADSLALKETKGKSDPYRLYNLDVFEYELNSPMALYGAVPLVYGHGVKQTVGVFWHNPTETWIDTKYSSGVVDNVVSSIVNFVSGSANNNENSDANKKASVHFMSETGLIDVFVLMGPTPKNVIHQYAQLTGTHPLPQYFSLGYHQSRWNYNDEEDVQSVVEKFDQFDLPLDVMWLDIEYTDGKKYFTWDQQRFGNAQEMQQNLTATGRKLVVIIDPHIKRESGYFLHETALEKGYYVKNSDGNVYEGWCWPGSSSYLDFLNPDVLEYYSSLYALDKFPQSTNDMYLWNDMNEPSVFNGPEVTMPKDCVHFNGWEHRDLHNIYGLLQTRGTFQGLIMRSKASKRPFILTRSFFAGSQKYAAVWTGDNAADWSHLAISIPMCLSLGLGGISFCGADVGGFFNNPDTELLLRWYQAGAFIPFYRAHAHIDTKRREPYLFAEDVRLNIRASLRKRYSFLPYWYSLFYEHEQFGAPVMKPLFMEYPQDIYAFSMDDQYLLGDLLVHPVTKPGVTSVSVYFPGGEREIWYDIDTYQTYPGIGYTSVPVDILKIPVYQRGGSIIPKRERIRRAASLSLHDPITLVIALDKENSARGFLYLDDGESYEYKLKQSYLHVEFVFAKNKLTAKQVNKNGVFKTATWLERVIIVGVNKSTKSAVGTSLNSNSKKLDVLFEKSKNALIIRKPGFNLAEEWAIELEG